MLLQVRIWNNVTQERKTIQLQHLFVSETKLDRVIRKNYPGYRLASFQKLEVAA